MKDGLNLFVTSLNECNLLCAYCADRSGDRFEPEKVLETIHKLAAPYRGKPDYHHAVSISGGEILLKPDFAETVADIFAGERLTLTLFTNGKLLSEQIDQRLQGACEEVRYVVGVDSSKEKALQDLLNNPVTPLLLKEQRVQAIYVVQEDDAIEQIEKDLMAAIAFSLPVKLAFDYYAKEKITDMADKILPVIRRTGYLPPQSDMKFNQCSQILVRRNGTWSRAIPDNCLHGIGEKEKKRLEMYHRFVCRHCDAAAYCIKCYPYMAGRYGLGNYCRWVKALAANTREEQS